MSVERLPVRIDPLSLAKVGRELQGSLRLDSLARLRPLLYEDGGEVEVRLSFGMDEAGQAIMRGRLRAALVLECQRCVGRMDFDIDTETTWGLVHSEAQADRLPEHYEALFIEAEPLYLADIIEDELLLQLPLVAKHEHDCIDSELLETYEDEQQETDEPRQENPFAVLSGLKTERDN